MKRSLLIPVILALAWLLGWFPPPAQAASTAENAPQMKASAAFEGYFKYGEWLPVWIDLENQGQDVEGEVRIQVSGSQGTIVYSASVSLPSGSHKLVPIYVLPNNFSRQLLINLVSQGKTLATANVTIHPQPNISFFIGLLAPERGALGLLNGITLPGQDRPKVIADVQLSDLPERVEGLRSFDVLVINQVDTSRLTPAQAAALQTWVQSGGRLVIGGGAGAPQAFAGLPTPILPVNLQGSIEVGAESLKDMARFAGTSEVQSTGAFVAAVGQPNEAAILAGTEALPLLVERPVGGGRVDFIALDLAAVPFNGWPGTHNFWEMLLAPGSAFPENMPFDVSVRQMRANQLSYALSNIPSLDLPSVQGVSILLIIYILFVGPINYLFLRWRKQMHMAWITIPVITLLFTAGSFGIGYALRGTDLILNRISLIQAQPGGTATVTSYMGLFSPRQQSYEILVNSEGLVSPMNGYDPGPFSSQSGGSPATGGEMTFIQGQPSTIKGLTVNQFSMQSFMSEENWQNFGQISGDLFLENDTLKGTIRNETAYPLTDVVVTFQNRFYRVGDMAPGQESNVDLGLSDLSVDRFGPDLSYRLFQENIAQSSPLPRSIELKMNILSSILSNGIPMSKMMALSSSMPPGGMSAGSAQSGSPILVLAWMNQAPPNVEVKNNRLSQQTTALVYSTLNYRFASSGQVSLPVGMIPGTLTVMPRDGGSCGYNGTASVNMSVGEAEFEFQVPPEVLQNEIQNLKVNLWRDNASNWSLPEMSIWDWNAEQWTVIQDPILGINVIQSPSAYI